MQVVHLVSSYEKEKGKNVLNYTFVFMKLYNIHKEFV